MRLAHVRDRVGPADAPWRLVAALDDGPAPSRWLDLEGARRRAVAGHPDLADATPFDAPVTTLDDHLARGLRVDVLAVLLGAVAPRDDGPVDTAVLDAADLAFGSPVLRPTSLRDGYGFEGHVRMVWGHAGRPVPDAWYERPVYFYGGVSEIRGPDEAVWAPHGSQELDFELEVAALIDTTARELDATSAEAAIGGYMVFNDWSARDLQRDEAALRLGPARAKDFASSFGPWLVTPDELADVRSDRGYDLEMTARVNGTEVSRGRWSDAVHGLAALAAIASTDAHLRPGDLLGSGTVGTGCLLEVRDVTLGRYLRPGDVVELEVERLGVLRSPVLERPAD